MLPWRPLSFRVSSPDLLNETRTSPAPGGTRKAHRSGCFPLRRIYTFESFDIETYVKRSKGVPVSSAHL